MRCICGCEAELPNKLIDTHLTASNVALELLVWDRTRTRALQSAATEGLITRGADCYQRLLATLHGGGGGADPVPDCEAWLEDSFAARIGRSEMTDKGGMLKPAKLRLTDDDIAQLDRLHPELSFSGHPDPPPTETERASEDLVDQLRGLRDLHAAGALTDEEFAAAKARVIERLE